MAETFNVLVEIPRGSKNKYEVDQETGRITLDRELFTAMGYPDDYGYIEGTLGEDGDPLDALVMVKNSVFPGCVIECRAVGLYHMEDEEGGDDKVLCVPADVRYDDIKDVNDVNEYHLKEIKHFFEQYKALEPNKEVLPGDYWTGADVPRRKSRRRVSVSRTRRSDLLQDSPVSCPAATCEDATATEPTMSRPKAILNCRTVAEKEIKEARERLANASK